jgi:exopolyphosphatase / guanosine-5'-triphosphate,3'-diphosphate pyrophosphatase
LPYFIFMRIGIVDCGTNTFNLLVADAAREGWNVVFQSKLPVKLGAGGFSRNEIMPSRFIRGLDALNCHKQNIDNFECKKVFAFATSAIREATNGKDFVQRVKGLTGIEINVIDGNREAELIYEGILQTIQLGSEPSLIMDIGGGSTEFIIASNEGIIWKKSFLLGVSRLHEMINPSDRMNSEQLDSLKAHLDYHLKPLEEALAQYPCKWLIGSSGSFDTLFEMFLQAKGKSHSSAELSNEIPLQTFPGLHSWLIGSTYDQRLKNPAIPSIRAEYMPLASFLVNYVIQLQPFTNLYHSAYSLKEGAIQDILSRIEWPKADPEKEKSDSDEDEQ